MAFRAVKSLISGSTVVAPPKDNFYFEAQAAIEKGAAIKYRTDGKVNKADTEDMDVVAIAFEEAEADEDKIRGGYVTPGMVYKCPMTKANGDKAEESDIHNDVEVGRTDLQMNADGTGVDVETDPGTKTGPLMLLDKDTENMVATVVFTSGALWNTKDSS